MDVKKALQEIAELEETQAKLAKQVLTAYDGALYPMDLLTVAAVNRSVAHCSGFRTMIEKKNLLCAGAILRLQVDTAARFSAAWRVDDPHKFAIALLDGEHVRRLRSSDGEKMTDRYLIDQLIPEADWIGRVYEKTSGYIHFSATHMMAALSSGREDWSIAMKISSTDKPLPNELYLEAAEAFIATTDLFVRYVLGWGYTKQNPQMTDDKS